MARTTTATLFLLLLLICSTLTASAARPVPALPHTTESQASSGGEAEAVEQSCELGISEEECLVRRTLVAHTDYIYTQKHNKP